jgi:hypothetical protein
MLIQLTRGEFEGIFLVIGFLTALSGILGGLLYEAYMDIRSWKEKYEALREYHLEYQKTHSRTNVELKIEREIHQDYLDLVKRYENGLKEKTSNTDDGFVGGAR